MSEFEMRKIADNPQSVFDRAKKIIEGNWIITKWYEKILFAIMLWWSVYSLGRWIFSW